MLGLNLALAPAAPAAELPAPAADLNSLVLPRSPPTGRSLSELDPCGPTEGVRAERPTLGARVEPTPTEGRRRTAAAALPERDFASPAFPVALFATVPASLGASSVAAGGAGVPAAVLDAREEGSGAGDGDAVLAVLAVSLATVPASVCPPTRRPRPRPRPDML